MSRIPFAIMALSLFAACSDHVQDLASEAYAPVFPVEPVVAENAIPTGGIYNAAAMGMFATDTRAAQVGDILTIDFTERFSASKSQSTGGSEQSDFSVDLPNILTSGLDNGMLDTGTDQSFAGRGNASQSNSLIGRVSVQVVRVLPGGNLEIMGQKRLTLNQGDEYVRVTGIVRQEDIDADNVIASDRIANADIRYIGAGEVADTSRPGWLRRGLEVVSPL